MYFLRKLCAAVLVIPVTVATTGMVIVFKLMVCWRRI